MRNRIHNVIMSSRRHKHARWTVMKKKKNVSLWCTPMDVPDVPIKIDMLLNRSLMSLLDILWERAAHNHFHTIYTQHVMIQTWFSASALSAIVNYCNFINGCLYRCFTNQLIKTIFSPFLYLPLPSLFLNMKNNEIRARKRWKFW